MTSEDSISRQDAINIVEFECGDWTGLAKTIAKRLKELSSVQPKEAIPITWLEEKAKFFDSLDNDLAIVNAQFLRAIINMWIFEKGVYGCKQ